MIILEMKIKCGTLEGEICHVKIIKPSLKQGEGFLFKR